MMPQGREQHGWWGAGSVSQRWLCCPAPSLQVELKKLYAQLEVCKTKEMTANNPHLPKKQRSSRQGLGRSFMRYLAEFPESREWQQSRL